VGSSKPPPSPIGPIVRPPGLWDDAEVEWADGGRGWSGWDLLAPGSPPLPFVSEFRVPTMRVARDYRNNPFMPQDVKLLVGSAPRGEATHWKPPDPLPGLTKPKPAKATKPEPVKIEPTKTPRRARKAKADPST
jgi:hypothetical protein